MIEKESKRIKRSKGGARPGAGRPKGRKSLERMQLEVAARRYAEDALEALNSIARHGQSESARVAAATALLDRGFGRPRQALEHSGEDGGPVQIHVTHEVIDSAA